MQAHVSGLAGTASVAAALTVPAARTLSCERLPLCRQVARALDKVAPRLIFGRTCRVRAWHFS